MLPHLADQLCSSLSHFQCYFTLLTCDLAGQTPLLANLHSFRSVVLQPLLDPLVTSVSLLRTVTSTPGDISDRNCSLRSQPLPRQLWDHLHPYRLVNINLALPHFCCNSWRGHCSSLYLSPLDVIYLTHPKMTDQKARTQRLTLPSLPAVESHRYRSDFLLRLFRRRQSKNS